MFPTRAAGFLVATASGLLVAGFLLSTIAPSALGFVLLVYLLHTRFAARAAFDATTIRLRRRVLEGTVHEGAPMHVELDGRPSTLGPGVRAEVRDRLPPGIEGEAAALVGLMSVTYAARPRAKGSFAFTAAEATLTDARGLWVERRRVPTETRLNVLASLDAIEAGRRLARRTPLDARTRSPVGLLIRELEFESIRPFAPGDRLRDVDWKRVAKFRTFLTKTWEKEREASVLLVLDAGRTMRAKRGKVSKLDHASTLLLELATAAAERNYRVGYVSFAEREILDEVEASRDRGMAARLAQRLAAVPQRIAARRRLDVGLPAEAPVDDAGLDFLEAVRGLRPRAFTAKPGVQAAIERASTGAGGQGVFLVVFTDLENLPDATLRALGRAAGAGHRVFAVVLPGSEFLDPPAVLTARELEAAYREEETRRGARSRLAALGVKVLEMGPESSATRIAAASQEAPRPHRGGTGP